MGFRGLGGEGLQRTLRKAEDTWTAQKEGGWARGAENAVTA
jgi:hypothetical protein